MSSNTVIPSDASVSLSDYIARHVAPLTCTEYRDPEKECAVCEKKMGDVHPYGAMFLTLCNHMVHTTCLSKHLVKPEGRHCPQCLRQLLDYNDGKHTPASIFAQLDKLGDRYATKIQRKENDRRRELRERAIAELKERAETKKGQEKTLEDAQFWEVAETMIDWSRDV